MNRPGNLSIALRALSALTLMFALTINVLPQHEGHVMPKPAAKPKPKAAPKKRRAAPRPRRTPTR
ncbi:MAG TPA: hypothetical protein VEW46_23790, partial [Pyrinomonadaceae bacterium]|nr:hypothetical protein [Pyrinomonadaceae bacterium]